MTSRKTSGGLPFQVQHLIFVNVQRILEEACFDAAKRHLPDVLKKKGWECAAQVQLDRWMDVLEDHCEGLALANDNLFFLHEVRDAAVKRIPLSSKTTIQLLNAAVRLVTGFEDSARMLTLDRIATEVESTIETIEQKRDMLLRPMRKDFRHQRDELKRKQREMESELLKDISGASLLETYVHEVLLAEARSKRKEGLGGSGDTKSGKADEGKGKGVSGFCG